MKDQPQAPKVKLEDLLRLKRAERPSPEFWVDFERTLRSKQLAAIVESRPWWRAPSFAFLRRRWVAIPASLTSAALVALVVVNRSGTHAPVAQVKPQSVAAPAVVAAVETPAPAASQAPAKSSPVSKTSMPDPATLLAGFEVKTPVVAASLDFGPVARQDETLVVTSVSMDAAQATEAIAEVPNQDSRRSRLMAYAENSIGSLSESASRVVRTRERMVSRMSEQALYDTISRLDVGGNHLSIKF